MSDTLRTIFLFLAMCNLVGNCVRNAKSFNPLRDIIAGAPFAAAVFIAAMLIERYL